jgi:DNA adenine methylase
MIPALPRTYERYFEPFLGGGSLFFLLQPEHAVLSDSCAELIATYEAVAEQPDAILRYLRDWKPDKDLFYEMRSNRSRGRYKRAAEFIYLNKTCWNGLYRVNGAGNFNVPYGAPKSNNIVDEANLRDCARTLAAGDVMLKFSDFADTVQLAREGDLVFMDPPYVTQHNNNGFIDYNETLFSWADQISAAREAAEAVKRGAHVIVTNAYHSDVLDLYPGFEVRPLERASTIASASSKRGRVQEAIFWKGP